MYKKKSIDVLLVNPYVADFKLYDEWMLPVGLLYISSLLKIAGIKVEFFDFLIREKGKDREDGRGKFVYKVIEKPNVYRIIPRKYKLYGIEEEIAKERLSSFSPKVIFLTSGMSYWYLGIIKSIKLLKEVFDSVPIVLGGIFPKVMNGIIPNELYSLVDFIFHKDVSSSDIAFLIKNMLGKEIHYNVLRDILSTPIDISLVYKPFGVLLTSIGCPFRCSYCLAWRLSSYKIRKEWVIEKELLHFHNKGIKNIAFYDDALLFRYQKNLIRIYKILERNGMSFSFHLPNGINARYITEDVAYLLRRMGVKTVRLGYEVDRRDLQIRLGDKAKKKELEIAIYLLKKVGFNDIGVYIMLHPFVSVDDFLATANFIHSLGVLVKPVLYSPIPNTSDFNNLVKKYPHITNPLYQNDSFFVFFIKKLSYNTWLDIKRYIDELNKKLKFLKT
jgi:hypothetical protein